MMKPLYKQPLVEAVILASGVLCTVVLIHGIQNFIALGGKPVTSQIAQKSNSDLVNVAAGGACPYSASVSLGQTAGGNEMRKNPTSDPKIYDPFEPTYTNQKSGTATPGVAKFPGDIDAKLPIIGTIFGYKPQSVNYYKVLEKDGTALTGTRWEQYLIGVPTEVGAEIRAPQTGYDIGGGKMGLVVYATGDQITIHVGRHEYLTGNGGSESGGYWIYLKGLCVNDQIVSQYNANATSRTLLPELAKGELLGYASGTEVFVAVRDDGPFMDILAPEWWTGVPTGSAAAAGVPPGGGAVVPARDVSEKEISDFIILNNVQGKHKDILRKDGTAVVVMGDSNTADKPFSIPGVTIVNRSAGFQGANWLKNNSGGLPKDSRFALILIGVNEVHNGNGKPEEGSINDFKANLQAAVNIILAQKIIPVLQEVNDFNNLKQDGLLENLKVVNDAIASVAETNNIPFIKTPYVKASHMKDDGYHFNDAGIALRNQILGVVNTKLTELVGGPKLINGRVCKADSDCLSNKCGMPAGSKIPDPICLPVTPAGKTVSGKIKLNGPGTYSIDIYQTDSVTNFNRTDDNLVAFGLIPTDQVQWSFEPKNSTTCIFAQMWTKTKDTGDTGGPIEPVEWANSEIRCGLKPGDEDVILTINGPAANKYTISGTILLTGGTLSGKEYVVSLSLYNPVNDAHQEHPIYTQRIVTKANIGYTIPSRYAGFYTSQAILYESDGTTKLYEVNDKYDLKTNISRDIPFVVPEDKTLPKYAITIKASKPTTATCPTATSPTISAYCLLGKVFNEQKGTVKLTIKDKAASNEKYRKYEGTIELGGGLRSNVMGIDIFEVSSASPISAGQVLSAKVGDNSIVFDPRLLNIQVSP